jgi:hypothetical protein
LQTLWFAPKGTPRGGWGNQAQFFIARSIPDKRLSFGLDIEQPVKTQAALQSYDPDLDMIRFMNYLNDINYAQQMDQLIGRPGWEFLVEVWNNTQYVCRTATELRELVGSLPPEQGWNVKIQRVLEASEAIAHGEAIVSRIMDTFKLVQPVWEAIMPEADRGFLTHGTLSPNGDEVRNMLETLLPDIEVRKACLNLFADYIIQANKFSKGSWEITLFPKRPLVKLNVGWARVFNVAKTCLVVLDEKALDDKDMELLSSYSRAYDEGFNCISHALTVQFSPENLPKILPVLHKAYLPLAEQAAQTTKTSPWYRSHSRGVIPYLRSFLGRRDIPDPVYNPQVAPPVPVRPVAVCLADSLSAQGFHFTPWQIATFYTALQTKGFVILSGISGTGKTKLAQHFAALLPQPRHVTSVATSENIVITIRPDHLKRSRFIFPRRALTFFAPIPPGASQDVTLKFEGATQVCRLSHYTGPTDIVHLYLRGKAGQWLKDKHQVGDELVLEPEVDEEQRLVALRVISDAQESPTEEQVAVPNHLFVSVRPDWRDSKSLLGYYNPLTSTYEWTDFLRFLVRVHDSYARGEKLAWFVILDEMNLAHVEYYFADLLSVLESGRDEDGCTREPLRLAYPDDATGDLPPSDLRLPPNLYIVGTVNVDETTHAFSPKVLDRAFTLELTEADFSHYPPDNGGDAPDLAEAERQAILEDFSQEGRFARIEKDRIAAYVAAHLEVRDRLQRLNELLRPHDLHFGYRVFDEIVSFLAAAKKNGLYAEQGGLEAAFDAAVLMKVLPKFHGSRGKLEGPLRALLGWCRGEESPEIQALEDVWQDEEGCRYPQTAQRVRRMLRALADTGFAAFA